MKDKGRSPRIRYDEGCLAAHALNLIGDRWALLVVRELMFTPKRFQMIRAGLPGITASVLNGRLTQLQLAAVVGHDERLGIYALTDAGRGLLPVLESLCRWALTVPGHDPVRHISPSALMISMGVTLVRGRALGGDRVAGFDFGSEAFEMQVRGRRVETAAVLRPQAPFVLSGSGNALARAVYGPAPLSFLAAQGVVRAEGDLAAAQAFLDLFALAAQPDPLA
ncbi:helix-turn-helix domain-containing protein [Paracoccaceae bacterium Fryx2]|nr:helix-turn-helix domain-containing protein [Paracoccaceae bacterium Fryx2]MDT8858378.1 helix-turn-helix domain-containing protein [Paracoccaceae bacterium Fryx2]